MTVVDVLGARRAAAVMRDTWGHLDATPGVRYPGTILFCHGEYGTSVVISSDFGDEAGYGPWFYEGLHDWLFDQDTEAGNVYRFTGWSWRSPGTAPGAPGAAPLSPCARSPSTASADKWTRDVWSWSVETHWDFQPCGHIMCELPPRRPSDVMSSQVDGSDVPSGLRVETCNQGTRPPQSVPVRSRS